SMPDGGVLRLATEVVNISDQRMIGTEEKNLILTVSDTGCGMDKSTLKCVCEPFFTTREKGQGMGLGLTTVYNSVEQHNGRMWIYSNPGKGSILKLVFPIDED
ncbi:hypothetical protein K8T06_14760, partial [bacterium]|nr:hypothetical protein [bacterium]